MTHYVGVLDRGEGVWGVRFPDFPGCVGVAETPEAALSAAAEALRDVVADRISAHLALPNPTSLAEVLSSGEVLEGETTVLVPLLVDRGRTVRANLTVDAGLLEAVDRAATARGITRSAFFASAARDKLISSA